MTNSRRQKVTPTKEKAFGQNDDLGVSKEPARRDHTHGTQDNPTSSHVAESDPHPQYLKKDQTVRQTIHSGMPLVEGFVFSETPTTVTTEAGTARWNADEDTLDIHGNGQVTQVGQELAPLYKNQTGSTITNGTPVMFAGAVGASGRLKIQGAIADGSLPAKYIIGLATQDIANGDDGHVTWFGKVRGIDTTGTPYGEVWADGDILFVSPTTAGDLTNVAPNAPDLQITVAAVVNAHATQGSLFVRPTFESKLCELDDVNGTALTTDGQIPVWDQAAGYFDFTDNVDNYFRLAGQSGGQVANGGTGSGEDLTLRSTAHATKGVVKVGGDASNHTEFEDDGTLHFVGDATTWKDIMFPMAPPKTTGAGNPSLVTWNGNLRGYSFAVNDAHDFDPQEIEHDAKVSSTATFHLHLITQDNETERTVKYRLEYAIEPVSGAVASPTTAEVEFTIAASTAVNTPLRGNITTFVIPGIARLVWARITRIASSGSEPSTDPVVGALHFHYELDTVGSREILTK